MANHDDDRMTAIAERISRSPTPTGNVPHHPSRETRALAPRDLPADAQPGDADRPDWANPCKHVAATHYVLGEALDRDPFLLFELRGRTKAQVLEALRVARAGREDERPLHGTRKRSKRVSRPSPAAPAVSLGKLDAADYERPRAPLPVLRLSFERPPMSGGLLRQLGTPAGWAGAPSPDELFAPLIRRAADAARRLAMGDPSDDRPH